jgi:large subunit ribosomal protein L25
MEAFPQDLPDSVEADISKLEVGDSLRVSDIVVPEACTVLTSLEETVASVVPPQAREVEEAEAVEGEVAEEEAAGATAEEAEGTAEQTEE